MRSRTSSIQSHLVVMGLALVLPVLAFSGLVLHRYVLAETDRLRQEVSDVARGVALSVDREIGHWETVLDLLAHSPLLLGGDLSAFHAQAREAVSLPGTNVVLRDRDGRQALNTLVPWGEPLPTTADPETDAKVFASKRAQASDVFVGAVSRKPLISVSVPVFRDGEVVQTLTVCLETAVLAAVLNDRPRGQGWVVGVADRKNTVIARHPKHQTFTGRMASAHFIEHAVGQEGSWQGIGLTGTPNLAAYSRTSRTGWVAVASVPEAVVLAPLYRSLALLAAFGAGLLVLALCLAVLLGRRIARPLLGLAETAAALESGRDLPAIAAPIREVQAVADALAQAAAVVQGRDRALRASEEQYRGLAESLPALVWIARRDGSAILQNRRVRDYTGISFLANVNAWNAVVHPEDLPHAAAIRRSALEGSEPYQAEMRMRRRDGVDRWHLVRGVPVKSGEGGQETCWLYTATDIEDLKQAQELQHRLNGVLEQRVAEAMRRLREEAAVRGRAEEQLRQTQKMEAISRLTAGIAHDFNNKLMVISANIDAVIKQVRKQPHLTRKLLAALVASDRAGAMMSKLLAFSHRQDLRPQRLDVAARLGSILQLLDRSLLTDAVTVDVHLPEGLWAVEADPHQLETAIVNLAVNARDAMPEGGVIAIEAGNVRLRPGEAEDPGLAGEFVRICVRDNGVGIAPDHRERVFEPFFTTKEPGKGTGLGLSQVYGFVRQLGGAVAIDSAAAAGTEVTLYLPRAVGSAGQAPEAGEDAFDEAEDEAPRRARILLVEDDVDVACAVQEMLEDMGHTVRVAPGGREALEMAGADTPDLVLTGVTMPGSLNGIALGREIRRRFPILPVVLITGNQTAVEDPAEFPVVSKPISGHRLDQAIRHQLGPDDPAKVVRLTAAARRSAF